MKNIGGTSLVYHFSEGTGSGVAITNFNVIAYVEMCGRRFVGFDENIMSFISKIYIRGNSCNFISRDL